MRNSSRYMGVCGRLQKFKNDFRLDPETDFHHILKM
jgi:hypothetical protein